MAVAVIPRGSTQRTLAERRREHAKTTSLTLGRSRTGRTGAFAGLIVLAVLWLLPFVWAIDTSFKSEADAQSLPLSLLPTHGFTLSAYRAVFSSGDIPRWMFNTLLVSVLVTLVTVAISALAAYGFSRTDFRGKKILFALVIASVLVPNQILIVPLFKEMLGLGLVDTYPGIILPQVVAPVMVFVLKRFFDAIPVELEDAARVDGASQLRIFWNIVLPLSRPILSAVSIFVFIGAWNNFLWPFIITNNPDLMTLPVGLSTVKNAFGTQYAQTMASSIVAAVPLLIVFLLFQRQIVKGISTTGLGGQ